MNQWLSEIQEICVELFRRDSSGEMWSLVAVCVLALFGLYGKLSAGFKGEGQRSLLTLVLGLFVMAIGVAAVRIYWSSDLLLQLAAALVVLLVIVIPFTAIFENASYSSAGLVWIFCLVVVAVILIVERPLVDSMRRGGIGKLSLSPKEWGLYEED